MLYEDDNQDAAFVLYSTTGARPGASPVGILFTSQEILVSQVWVLAAKPTPILAHSALHPKLL